VRLRAPKSRAETEQRNSRERYIRSLTFDSPDRVPVMHHTLKGAWTTYCRELENLYARYPSDVLLSSRTHEPFALGGSERGHWAGGQVTYDDWGCGWLWNTPDHMGQTVYFPLAYWDVLETYRPPDPMSGEEAVEQMVAEVDADGHQHFVFVDGGELFQRMIFMRGMENLMIDLHEDREEVYVLRDLITEVCLKRIERWGATGKVDGIILRDDWGTQQALMIQPRTWRQVFLPAYEKLVEAIHATGAFASFHSDGVIDDILPDLVAIGCDEINPQVHVMDIEALGDRYRGDICVRADMDRQYTMPDGKPEEVRQLVHRLYAAFGSRDGGYVGWAEMNSDVPIANAEAMLETFYSLPPN